MNIFLPYEDNIAKSVRSLDDLRLNKQAVETYQLCTSAIKEKNGEEIRGHKNHPVYVFYKNNIDFLAYYGLACCFEYEKRFLKGHSLKKFFIKTCNLPNIDLDNYDTTRQVAYIPYYMEGSIKDKNCIRTTENVSKLFQEKLILKWNKDSEKGRPPKWTNTIMPNFYTNYIKKENDK